MPRPRFCVNPQCPCSRNPDKHWLVRNGTYHSAVHGTVQRYECRRCRCGMSEQTASIHYYAKRRLDLRRIFVRLRGGSSMRDIARELGVSPTAIANAVLRLGRQAMGSHTVLLAWIRCSGELCFDGLLSSLTGSDYPAQITTLGDSHHELLLAMSHCVTHRAGTRTDAQRERIRRRHHSWRPQRGALTASITLLVRVLSRFIPLTGALIDTDEHPIYQRVMHADLALRWYRSHRLVSHRTTPSVAPRTTANPLFLMNYLDRMIRHRMREHTRQSIAFARNATMQMHRMWIFAWDHNCCQPMRVKVRSDRCRAAHAGMPSRILLGLQRRFFTRRVVPRGAVMPDSMRQVWTAALDTPVVRWQVGQRSGGPSIPAYALRDLSLAHPQGP